MAEPHDKPRNAVRSNRWDVRAYQSLARPLRPVDDLIDDLMDGDEGQRRPGFELAPELVEDTFMALYQPAPRVRERVEVAPEARGLQQLMVKLVEHPSLTSVQEHTAGDSLLAALAVEQVGPVLREVLTRAAEEESAQPESQQQGQGGGQPGPGDDQQSDQGDGSGSGSGDGQEEGDGQGDDGSQGVDWEAMLDDLDVDRLLHRALEKAREESEQLEAASKSFGLESGDWKAMDPTARLAMARRLNSPKMRKLAEMIGRMTRFALGVRQTRITEVPQIVYGIERGNTIRNVLPREFALLNQGDGAHLDFFRRYANRDLAQYAKRGVEKAAKGPLVVCIDKSGSMDGNPFDWAMGAAEAMRRLASDDDRDYSALFFGANRDRHRFEFPKGKATSEQILAFCAVVADGGTQFDGVLTEALGMASKSFDDEGRTKADIVFITDGEASLNDRWIQRFNDERKRVGVRVHSVYIGGAWDAGFGAGSRARTLLDRLSDQVINVNDLVPESVESVFTQL